MKNKLKSLCFDILPPVALFATFYIATAATMFAQQPLALRFAADRHIRADGVQPRPDLRPNKTATRTG